MNPFKIDKTRRLVVIVLITNLTYLVWLGFHIQGILGIIFLLLEIAIFGVSILFAINYWTREFVLIGGSYSLRASIDVFVPTVNEPLHMLRNTLAAAAGIEHPRKFLYLLDDGGRPEVRRLAGEYGFTYLQRPDAATKRYKAANLNYGLAHSTSPFVLVIDADNVVTPSIADDLLGHFGDPAVAFVASRQEFTVESHDFNHDHLFYNHMQTGKHANNAAISCGSGVIYRRRALQQIGGFSEWNLVEDLHTSYVFHAKGFKGVYASQPYVRGHAPRDVSAIYKQRGTWALDTMRILFWDSPLTKRGLRWRQRLHYFEMGYCYIVSAFFLSGIYLINFYTLFTDTPIHNGGVWYILFRLPALVATLWLFGYMSRGQLTSQVWAGLFPVYAQAAILAMLSPRRAPKYKVSSKIDRGRREIVLVLPQIGFIAVGVTGLVYNFVRFGPSPLLAFSGFWTAVMAYWLTPMVMKGLKLGIYARELKPKPQRLAQAAT